MNPCTHDDFWRNGDVAYCESCGARGTINENVTAIIWLRDDGEMSFPQIVVMGDE